MCGICGILNTGSEDSIHEKTIRRMCSVLKHRGPDDEGVYLGWNENGRNRIGLGIRRLAIIDLETGHQPIHNEDKTIRVVCNGEIYNFAELRKELEDSGHRFYTHSDAETIVHLYEEYGVECLNFLRGMFALAIWDERRKRLFLARDRVGQKPLYYTQHGKQLIFASEIKSILQIPRIPREVNSEAIHHYLTYKYVPAPLTAFKNIQKLSPAHYLVWERGKVSVHRYWELNRFFAPLRMTEEKKGMAGEGGRMTGGAGRTTAGTGDVGSRQARTVQQAFTVPQAQTVISQRMTEGEYCERIRELLEEATRLRLVSDVPLGAFLSGGTDSSIIVGLMSEMMDKPVKTFSIGFEEKAYNELDYARIVAQHFKTDHHEYVVKPDALGILPKLIWHYDEPFADSSSVPSYYVAKMTRQEVTVALNGDGGDENFAGYPRYKAIKLAEQYGRLPKWMRENVIDNIVKRIPYSPERKSSVRQFRKLMEGMNYPPEQRHARWTCIFDNETKDALYTSSFKKTLRGIDSVDYLADYHRNSGCENFLDSALFVDIMTYLPGDLLVKMDIATMANSLETRSPFLDHKFMEFAAGIPFNLKVKGLNTSKYILKKAFSGFVPQSILRRKKMGFAVPISRWFRNELKEYAYDILLSRKSLERGYFQEESLKSILDEHCSLHYDHGDRLWALLNFELWQRMFIDRAPDGKL